jgi:hypothetical protein
MAWSCLLSPAPVRGLKSLLCKEGRLVVQLAVPFCFCFFVGINSVRWGTLYAPMALSGPLEGQVAISPTQQPQLPKLQLGGTHAHYAEVRQGVDPAQ